MPDFAVIVRDAVDCGLVIGGTPFDRAPLVFKHRRGISLSGNRFP